MASGGGSEEAQLAQCQAYVQHHNIQHLVKEAIVGLCIHKPKDPVLFLKEHFEKLYEQRLQPRKQHFDSTWAVQRHSSFKFCEESVWKTF
ncbi:hypothetical protein AB6A40_009817 [Gnathostoma spinigerum]|uniref:RIIa domain-containing protein n=1 Tax=Gnathostoma spinigerum TaxID=75299 RepID=A0ABD6ET29_9BILA